MAHLFAGLFLVAGLAPAGGAPLEAGGAIDHPLERSGLGIGEAPHHHQRVTHIDRVIGAEAKFAARFQFVRDHLHRPVVHHPPLRMARLGPGVGVEQVDHRQRSVGNAREHLQRVAIVQADIGEPLFLDMDQRLRDALRPPAPASAIARTANGIAPI